MKVAYSTARSQLKELAGTARPVKRRLSARRQGRAENAPCSAAPRDRSLICLGSPITIIVYSAIFGGARILYTGI